MKYSDFTNKAIAEDARNSFSEHENIQNIPSSMTDFFRWCNPVDVEISYPSLGALKFHPYEELEELQSEYHLPENYFVFASCNGDPVFEADGKIFTTLHGVCKPEAVADSFDDFINEYVSKT